MSHTQERMFEVIQGALGGLSCQQLTTHADTALAIYKALNKEFDCKLKPTSMNIIQEDLANKLYSSVDFEADGYRVSSDSEWDRASFSEETRLVKILYLTNVKSGEEREATLTVWFSNDKRSVNVRYLCELEDGEKVGDIDLADFESMVGAYKLRFK